MLLTAGNVFCIDCVCMGICTGHELSSRSLDLRRFYIMMAGRRSRNSLFNSRYLWRACRERAHNRNKTKHYIFRKVKRQKKNILLLSRRLIKICHLNGFKGGPSHPQAQCIPHWAPASQGPVHLTTAPHLGVNITKELVFGRVLLRGVLRLDIVRALIRVSVVKNDPVLEMVITQWMHTVFLSALLFSPHTLFLTPCLPTNLSIYLCLSVVPVE